MSGKNIAIVMTSHDKMGDTGAHCRRRQNARERERERELLLTLCLASLLLPSPFFFVLLAPVALSYTSPISPYTSLSLLLPPLFSPLRLWQKQELSN